MNHSPASTDTGSPVAPNDLRTMEGHALASIFFDSLLPNVPRLVPNGDPADPTGDHVLNPDFASLRPPDELKPAAVLIAVDIACAEPHVLLTVRTATLSAHAGQIAFPGGRLDPGELPQETAMREAHEEVDRAPGRVSLRGFLPTYASRTGYRVFPVVGSVEGLAGLSPSPAEVDAIFHVPLRFLLDPANASYESRIFEGKARYFYAYQFEKWCIWGLTAGIVHHMSERIVQTLP